MRRTTLLGLVAAVAFIGVSQAKLIDYVAQLPSCGVSGIPSSRLAHVDPS